MGTKCRANQRDNHGNNHRDNHSQGPWSNAVSISARSTPLSIILRVSQLSVSRPIALTAYRPQY
eukprot:3173741-Pyramimonas_sp.AAC.1